MSTAYAQKQSFTRKHGSTEKQQYSNPNGAYILHTYSKGTFTRWAPEWLSEEAALIASASVVVAAPVFYEFSNNPLFTLCLPFVGLTPSQLQLLQDAATAVSATSVNTAPSVKPDKA